MFWLNKKYLLQKRGYSLLEAMVTVAIIATIAGIGGPTFLKRRAKARRVECTSMLSYLSKTQTAYINNNSSTYNQIHCPKHYNGGLHTSTVSGEERNVITVGLMQSQNYCNYGATGGPVNSEGSLYPVPNDVKVVYQYRVKACSDTATKAECAAITAGNLSDVATGSVFPPFVKTNNSEDLTNPAAMGAITEATVGVATVDTPYEYVVGCSGNIDTDAAADNIYLDSAGTLKIFYDDVSY